MQLGNVFMGRRTQQAATAGRTARVVIELLAALGLLAARRSNYGTVCNSKRLPRAAVAGVGQVARAARRRLS